MRAVPLRNTVRAQGSSIRFHVFPSQVRKLHGKDKELDLSISPPYFYFIVAEAKTELLLDS